MTDTHVTPAVTHDDGVQNGPVVRFLSHRIPAGLGGAIVTLLTLLVAVAWVWSAVVTWRDEIWAFLPFFQTTVAAVVVLGVAVYGRKTLAWIAPLVFSAVWITVSVLPLDPIFICLTQAASVALLVASTVVAVVAIDKSNAPRF